MHGYTLFADYAIADTMAGSPTRVMELLEVLFIDCIRLCLNNSLIFLHLFSV